ncbi:uncharacterized protein N7479_003425 [Penicillium vulpinum]|uniref:uncharacterized protein n=1 Tax=Penicillium vulpinum TaxID=29845 RepID=UPI002548F00F|nr:uncharacterized protein N7479_003425 [Penicillium vulpinum]KAJ5963549.1 hypothetical protein N7479_003425 [Penicillium vulpinum]
MDETLPDSQAITVPVPIAEVTTEDKYRACPITDASHFVVQRLDSIMLSVAGISYDSNKPWPFWFFIGKILSKSLFEVEGQLEWLNAVRVRSREFIAFTKAQYKSDPEKAKLQIVEIDFLKPQPNEPLKLFWKPARGIICQKVQDSSSIEILSI